MKESEVTILDAFGNQVKVGDTIVWISNPSTSPHLVKGTVCCVDMESDRYGRPVLQVKPVPNDYTESFWEETHRLARLVDSYDVTPREKGSRLQRTHFLFSRITKIQSENDDQSRHIQV